ncbi:multicopper oxidase family protein [Nocardioides pantholopis]|uniref:multicopper oxidase family protein n=1 Tax=Nocardioides pantholopis TaxID=2483798 RepID=UPI000F09397D|nr:multicopper oxidase domain-containing protein [Nocardioides pantholopis]
MRTEPRRLSRRSLLRAGLAVAALAGTASACDGLARLSAPAGSTRLRSPARFDTPLAVPPLQEGLVAADGTRELRLTARAGRSDLGGPRPTATWGYDGPQLGPTLRARVGEQVRVTVANELPETTTVHWHGMHLPAAMDGGPHQPIAPGETWTPTWRVDQAPATLWYHPHPHGETEEHVYRGLAGFFLLDAPDGPDAPGLPHRYGIDDFPVLVQDKRLDQDGELEFDDHGNEIGLLGDRVVTNGVHGAYLDVGAQAVRLRLLNGSTARSYRLGFGDDRAFDLVGTDGGLLERPVRQTRVRLSPGERAELVVRLSPGETVRLRSDGAELGAVVVPEVFGADDTADLLELRAVPTLTPAAPLPATLTRIERLDPTAADRVRRFELEGREINGRRMAMDRVDETVTLGATEVWEVRNRNLFPHNFHVHDVQFQVLTIDGEPPPPELAGRKDTVYLEPRRTYRLILRFEDHADPRTPYMFHCHLLLHEDDGMMGQFVVVEPGDHAEPVSGHAHH